MQNQTVESILEALEERDRAQVVKAVLMTSMAENESQAERAVAGLSDLQRHAVVQILLLKLNESSANEKVEKKKQNGEKIRRTAEILLQKMLEHWTPSSLASSDADFCDRAIKMAQRLHDAT